MYFVKIDGPEERWVTWGRWSTNNPEDEGFYTTSCRARACLITEEFIKDELVLRQLAEYGAYTLFPADEEDIKRHRSRIFKRL